MKPWHDSIECRRCKSPTVVPEGNELASPTEVKDVSCVRCASCGHTWLEEDVTNLARVWWSAGAYVGAIESGGRP